MKMKSQKLRCLEFLQSRGEKGVQCREFTRLTPGIMRYGARCRELKQEGYKINCVLGWDGKKRQKLSTYVLKFKSK